MSHLFYFCLIIVQIGENMETNIFRKQIFDTLMSNNNVRVDADLLLTHCQADSGAILPVWTRTFENLTAD